MPGPVDTIRKVWKAGGEKGLTPGQPSSGTGSPWWISPAGYMRQLRDVGAGTSSSIVVASLNVLVNGFSEAPLAVYEPNPDGTPTIVDPHDVSTLIESPNPVMTSDLLWHHYIWSTRVDGNAYWYKERNLAGGVVELWPLRSDLVKPKAYQGSPNLIDFYEYRPTGTAVYLDPADVVHLRSGLDPNDHRLGQAPLKVVLKEILGDEEASRFSSALLSNMAIPGVILSPGPGELGPTEADADRIRDGWRERFGGDRRGDPLVLSGPMQVQVVAFSPKDLDLKALRRVPEERISAVLGVPAILAGLGAGLEASSGRSESVTLVEMFTERTLVPEWRRVGRILTRSLLPEFDDRTDRWVDFDLSDVRSLQEDENAIWTRVDTAIRTGWLTVAEGKRMVGMEPLPEDEVYLRSVGTTERPLGTVDVESLPEAETDEGVALRASHGALRGNGTRPSLSGSVLVPRP